MKMINIEAAERSDIETLSNRISELEKKLANLQPSEPDQGVLGRLSALDIKTSELKHLIEDFPSPEVADLESRISDCEDYESRISDLEFWRDECPDLDHLQSRLDDLESEENGVVDITTRLTACEAILAEVRLEHEAVKRAYASLKQPEVALDSPFV